MNEKPRYYAGITCEQFLFYELRLTASLLLKKIPRDEIREKIITENLFQYPTERTVRRIISACFKRIDALNSNKLLNTLSDSSADIAKQICLYAFMKQNKIVWDFMTMIIGEKFRRQEYEFTKKDMNIFFYELQEREKTIAEWSDSTIKKIKQVLVKSITECGYLDSVKSEILNPVYLYPELEDEIRAKEDYEALPAFNYFI